MAYKQEAELIREDIDLYTFLGLSVFVAYFVSWGTDFYKDCRKKSKAKKARKYRDRDRRTQVAEEKEIEMVGKGEYKENGMNTVKNPMHQNINISPVGKKKDKKKKKKGKDCSKMLDCSNINTSLISTLTGNILVLLFILLNMYILGNSWWYTISRSDPRDYFA